MLREVIRSGLDATSLLVLERHHARNRRPLECFAAAVSNVGTGGIVSGFNAVQLVVRRVFPVRSIRWGVEQT